MKYNFAGLIYDEISDRSAGASGWAVTGISGSRSRLGQNTTFDEHYSAAREGRVLEVVKPAPVITSTVDNLCNRYLEAFNMRFKGEGTSVLTLKGYRSLLRQSCNVKDDLGD